MSKYLTESDGLKSQVFSQIDIIGCAYEIIPLKIHQFKLKEWKNKVIISN